jgi:GDPmannose 4,6-dehydratase
MRKALILGVDGQDGSYLAQLLLSKGYIVVGWVPDIPGVSLENIQSFSSKIELKRGSLLSQEGLSSCLEEIQPDEVYNFAAPSSPAASWQNSVAFGDAAGLAVARILDAIRQVCPQARFYQASTSEMFGDPLEVPQCETTPFRPRNPYGVAKLFGHWMTVNYRQQHGMFAVSGILYNHESPRRALGFVTRKITHTAAKIKLGQENKLLLGNLDARRDWGYAPDYVEAIWRMLHAETPDDFIIGTGVTHSVRELCELAFGYFDLDYHDFVEVDPRFFRPLESGQLVADPAKARKELGWEARTTFKEIIHEMAEADLKLLLARQ